MTPSEKIKRLVERLRDEADDCGAFRNEAGYAKLSEAASVVEALWAVLETQRKAREADWYDTSEEQQKAVAAAQTATDELNTLIESIQE